MLTLYVDILYIYIVKRRRPCFVGGAIKILSIDWLNKMLSLVYAYNFSHFAIYLQKLINIGGNLTKF